MHGQYNVKLCAQDFLSLICKKKSVAKNTLMKEASVWNILNYSGFLVFWRVTDITSCFNQIQPIHTCYLYKNSLCVSALDAIILWVSCYKLVWLKCMSFLTLNRWDL